MENVFTGETYQSPLLPHEILNVIQNFKIGNNFSEVFLTAKESYLQYIYVLVHTRMNTIFGHYYNHVRIYREYDFNKIFM